MKKNSLLSQLAMAGIAAGLVSTSVLASDMADSTKPAMAGDSAKTMGKKKHKPAAKKEGAAKVDSTKASTTPVDSTKMGEKTAATAPKHDCKGLNSCKGQGGCKMSQADLDAAAKKLGVPMEKAGKAHSCKTKNDCKGLGGCKGA